ncbi:hypothetical protein OHA37_03495 [Streptomyces sp. NBC_00335]|uniref:hypothetical protein n=1 Tax=unclassified Streptomyces TaxID=2593676 RepID=UPI002258F4F8|nr:MULTISPECIES: hypothetical protein [unclassified Streptomyces]MCX5402949.1 hypothetical protein [Streptomyces sp. NBC_00086]
MQPIPARHRVPAVGAGVLAVLLLVCGGLFTHPASTGHVTGTPMAGMADMAGVPVMAGMPAMPASDTGPAAGAGAGTDGGCSASGQDCPLASAYAPTVQAGPAGDLAGSAMWVRQPAADGHPRPVPSPECSRPGTPDPDSLCVSRT